MDPNDYKRVEMKSLFAEAQASSYTTMPFHWVYVLKDKPAVQEFAASKGAMDGAAESLTKTL